MQKCFYLLLIIASIKGWKIKSFLPQCFCYCAVSSISNSHINVVHPINLADLYSLLEPEKEVGFLCPLITLDTHLM